MSGKCQAVSPAYSSAAVSTLSLIPVLPKYPLVPWLGRGSKATAVKQETSKSASAASSLQPCSGLWVLPGTEENQDNEFLLSR